MSADLEDTLTVVPSPVALGVDELGVDELDLAETVLIEQLEFDRDADQLTDADQPTDADPRASGAVAPSYYGFRMGAGTVVPLDAVAYIGRRPSAPRIVRGGRARLVRVSSPTFEVSSTHIELRQSGRTIVVHDLQSTNGTRVGVPGHPVRSLRPGESLVVPVGTLIDIGDRNVIEILHLQDNP